MGRHKKHASIGKGKAQRKLTPGRVKMYARKGFTKTEMAVALGISLDAVTDNFNVNPEIRAAWDEGQTQKVQRLRDLQWRHAKTSVPMTIHMSRHQLGEHDQSLAKVEHSGEIGLLHQLFKVIDGTGRGLPDPAKVRLPIEYQPMVTVEAVHEDRPSATDVPEIFADQIIEPTMDEIVAADPPTSRALVMPPRIKSLLPDREKV